MNRKKVIFIYNPVSGKGKIKNDLSDVIDTLVKNDYIVEVRPTQYPNDAEALVSSFNIEDFDKIICSGGDGTLDSIVAGLIKRDESDRVPIGYLPAGSTNDFASSLGIPTNAKEGIRTAIDGVEFPCDVGLLGDRPFVYVAAFGLFTSVSYETAQDLKNVLGHFAYILKGAGSLADIKGTKLRIETDDHVTEDTYILGLITNSKSVGGIRNIIQESRVKFDDGKFEVTLIKEPKTPLALNSILRYLVDNRQESKYIETFSTSNLKVTCLEDEPLAWTVDGEYGGRYDTVEIANLQKAVTMMIPKTPSIKPSEYYSIEDKKENDLEN